MAAICSAICWFTAWKHESNEIVQWTFFTRRLQTGLRKDTMRTVINSCAQYVFIKHKGLTGSSIRRSLSVLQLRYSRLFIWLYFFYYLKKKFFLLCVLLCMKLQITLDVSMLSLDPPSDKKDLSFVPPSSTSTSTKESPKKTILYAIQSFYIIPVVDVVYNEQQAKLMEDLDAEHIAKGCTFVRGWEIWYKCKWKICVIVKHC